jgi:hypothetical protein
MRAELWSSDRRLNLCGGGGRRLARCGPITLAALLGVAAMLGAEVSHAQQPTVEPRERAGLACPDYPPDPNIPNKRGWEPAVAAGPDDVITVFHIKDTGVGYGVYDTLAQQWVDQGTIDTANYPTAHDPAIAYNSQTGGFVAVARTTDGYILCSHYSPTTAEFGPWDDIAGSGAFTHDKPWIVAGDPNLPTGQEFYLTWHADYEYRRSIDGGDSWVGGQIIDSDTGQPVIGGCCPQPAVYQGGPLYVAYVNALPSSIFIRFLVGEDIDDPNDPNYGGVRFRHLHRPATPLGGPMPLVPLTVPLNHVVFNDHLPGNFEAKLVPQLAVDPTDPDRLYVVYHDTATAASSDVNVYLRVLTRSTGNWWTAGPGIQVNDDATEYESDQFLPCVVVDEGGYIHVMYYDDKQYTDSPEGDLQPDETNRPKFDVFYAWSPSQGATWFHEELYGEDPPEAALDCVLRYVDPHEYNGITWYGDSLWTTYAGTWSGDQQTNKAVILSSRVDW